MSWLMDLRLRSKLFLGFGLMIFIIAAETGAAYKVIARLREGQHLALQHEHPKRTALLNFRSNLNRIRELMLETSLTAGQAGKKELAGEADAAAAGIDACLQTLSGLSAGEPALSRSIAELKAEWKVFNDTRKEKALKPDYRDRSKEAAALAPGAQKERYENMRALALVLDKRAEANIKKVIAETSASTAKAVLLFVLLGLGALAAAVLFALFLTRSVVAPLAEISAAAESISRGELAVVLPSAVRKDEVGSLAASFSRMAAYLRNLAEAAGRIGGRDFTTEIKPVSDKDMLGNAFRSLTGDLLAMTRDMQRALERENMVLRSLPMAFFYAKTEKDGLRIEWVSEGVEKLCGCKPAEFLAGRDLWASRVHPEDKERVLADMARLAEAGTVSVEYRWRTSGGEYRWFLANAATNDGHALGFWLDISGRKTLEQQFLQAQKMEAVGRLAGGVAHDFNNLLTAINGYAGFLLKSLAPDDKRRDDAVEIMNAAEVAAGLTRQLLAFSRRQVLQLKVLDCNAVIRNTQNMVKRLIGENIALELDLAKEECRTKTDPGQLEQVILNLAVNARDAMPDGGKVSIKTENMELSANHSRMHMEMRPGPHVMLSVADTGCGMAPDVMARVFEPFFTTKEPGKGTGLGLATVYGIVKQSGGNIYVYSEPGLGTTFKIYLPRVTEEPEASAAPVPAQARPGSETILLAEDDDGMRGFAQRALSGNGYTVLAAGNAEEAVRLSGDNTRKIDLLLTDTIMPGMNGHELYKKLSERRPGIKVVFMSGYGDTDLANIRLTAGNPPFLQKPFSADDLARKVREVLDAPAAVRP